MVETLGNACLLLVDDFISTEDGLIKSGRALPRRLKSNRRSTSFHHGWVVLMAIIQVLSRVVDRGVSSGRVWQSITGCICSILA